MTEVLITFPCHMHCAADNDRNHKQNSRNHSVENETESPKRRRGIRIIRRAIWPCARFWFLVLFEFEALDGGGVCSLCEEKLYEFCHQCYVEREGESHQNNIQSSFRKPGRIVSRGRTHSIDRFVIKMTQQWR